MTWRMGVIFTNDRVKVWADIFWIRFSLTLIRWCFMPGFTGKSLVFTGCCPGGFPMPFTTRLRLATWQLSIACWICVKTLAKSIRL
jgi:hypothetical protein